MAAGEAASACRRGDASRSYRRGSACRRVPRGGPLWRGMTAGGLRPARYALWSHRTPQAAVMERDPRCGAVVGKAAASAPQPLRGRVGTSWKVALRVARTSGDRKTPGGSRKNGRLEPLPAADGPGAAGNLRTDIAASAKKMAIRAQRMTLSEEVTGLLNE